MSYVEERPQIGFTDERRAHANEWRRLTRFATAVAFATSPLSFAVMRLSLDLSLPVSIIGTFFVVIAFRGLIDIWAHKFVPRASLYGAEKELLEDDVVSRRRLWYWTTKWRRWTYFWIIAGALFYAVHFFYSQSDAGSGASFGDTLDFMVTEGPQFLILVLPYLIIFPLLMVLNFAILFGPLLFFGLKQMKAYEPGDADWGVKLSDVRGQTESKEEVARVITLWQQGEEFAKAGGKPERGLLFIGAPGTGKTMLSKGIATSFNSPIMTMPGSGFAQTFIGMDVVVVMILISRARKLARKWGGQCIIFIDEIDAVGLRRQALGSGMEGAQKVPQSIHDVHFHGPMGAITPTGDLVIESAEWRERIFAERAGIPDTDPLPAFWRKVDSSFKGFMMPGGMMGMGGGMALNQLLVQMDGVDEPPWKKRVVARKVNTFLDATYIVPRKIRGRSLRKKAPAPREEQIYFIGATNVPIDRLDPALIRPGRMGRHIWFRTPDKGDRADIFDLYLDKVEHDPDLDTDRRRDELARITNGYSPAMIEQVCSMALTYAHAEGRLRFGWNDIVEAMTTIESGTAVEVEYMDDESRSIAIHEAGHAIAAHVYRADRLVSTRLSIRKRGGSLGHHMSMQKDERFNAWRSERFASLVHTVGAMAAERVFYGENSMGVGGDLHSATDNAAIMVGFHGMGPEPVSLKGKVPDAEVAEREAEIMDRFEQIGMQLMNRGRNPAMGDSLSAVLQDGAKRRAAAQLLGQAYLAAQCLVMANRQAVENIAEELIHRREMYGDEVMDLLDRQKLVRPPIDLLDESIWPKV